ncbi:MAG: hypothetical protein GC162_08735 [Planctomycetes bacterium]|nr:hypothetical protein [Planctomycetota bacterium]
MNCDIENLLKAQPLVKPSASLDERVSATVANKPPLPGAPLRWRPLLIFAAAGTAMAASIGFAMMLNTAGVSTQPMTRPVAVAPVTAPDQNTTTASQADEFDADEPIRIDTTYETATPGDLVYVDDNVPMIPVVHESVRTTAWIDPVHNVRMEMTIPTQTVILTAMSVD